MNDTTNPKLGTLLENYFNKIYIINLDRRAERWQEINNHLRNIGFQSFERISAVDGAQQEELLTRKIELPFIMRKAENKHKMQQGHLGCFLSHLKVLKLARTFWQNSIGKCQQHRVLILEDDCFFEKNLSGIAQTALEEIGNDWNMIMFGANHRKRPLPWRNSTVVVRVQKAFGAHAYAINSRMYERTINLLEAKLQSASIPPVDIVYTEFQKAGLTLALNPLIAGQRSGWSDLELKEVNHARYFRTGIYINNWTSAKITAHHYLSMIRIFILSLYYLLEEYNHVRKGLDT